MVGNRKIIQKTLYFLIIYTKKIIIRFVEESTYRDEKLITKYTQIEHMVAYTLNQKNFILIFSRRGAEDAKGYES
jgi:hypothetical protein